jgi:hypothetical protein
MVKGHLLSSQAATDTIRRWRAAIVNQPIVGWECSHAYAGVPLLHAEVVDTRYVTD